MSTSYTLDGELWSGCIHMTPIDRATAKRLISRYGRRTTGGGAHRPRVERERRGFSSVEFELRTSTSTLLPKGYTYRVVRVGLTRDRRAA